MEKYAFITGGTKGIGKAVAECLAKAGYQLILTFASDVQRADEVRMELARQYGISVQVLQADSSDMNSIETIAAYLENKKIRLEALVLNAGLTCRDTFEKMQFAD